MATVKTLQNQHLRPNLSAEPAHGFFAQGLTQDIIGALSRIKELLVVSNGARQTSGAVDLARELGVGFILEGSVRASGTRIRVAAHLVDGRSGNHVWAERYEGELGDIFTVQDQITQAIALAMQVKLTAGDMARFWEGQTRDLRAWEKMVAARDASCASARRKTRRRAACSRKRSRSIPSIPAPWCCMA
jgi:adenylate cyclase